MLNIKVLITYQGTQAKDTSAVYNNVETIRKEAVELNNSYSSNSSSRGISTGVTIGYNQDTRDKEGITRNTIVGNVEIGTSSGSPINRDLNKANETTRDESSSTNINIESQTIEYALNPTKFREDLEVAVLEGKATGETILKTIENLLNGGKEDIGEPERRSLNEIKEVVIRVKTAPEMEAIARGDLNSEELLNKLDIDSVERFNPDDTSLPENIRERVDELSEDGKVLLAFYDAKTNKIFVNENLSDDEVRAAVAREWKISEDLKKNKGKENTEGQLKSTVAGELAYDDMKKRAGEGRTEEISVTSLKEAVMREDSEVTSDQWASGSVVPGTSWSRKPGNNTKETEKQRIQKELSSKDCNGKCKKEQQKVYEDYMADAGQMLSCHSSDKNSCNPRPNNTSELIIFRTDKELIEYSNKLKELGIRGNYRLDSQERIDRNYNNSSNRVKQAIDYENVLNSRRSTGKSAEELYKEGKITQRQYENYNKEKSYIGVVTSYSNVWNNSVRPIVNSVYVGTNPSVREAYKEYEISSGRGSLYNNNSSPTISQSNRNSIETRTGKKLENISLHEGKQGKHVVGHNNFQSGKSEIDMQTAKNVLNEYKGTGRIEVSNQGKQVKEIIDTHGKYTGIHVNLEGERSITSRFTIHYDSKGTAHIIPASPKP